MLIALLSIPIAIDLCGIYSHLHNLHWWLGAYPQRQIYLGFLLFDIWVKI